MKKLIKDIVAFFGLTVLANVSIAVHADNAPVSYGVNNGLAVGVALSSSELSSLVGGVAPNFTVPRVRVDVTDYSVEDRDSGQPATAVFVNQTGEQVSYTFEVISINGSVLEVLELGTVEPGETITSSVAPTVSFVGLGKGLRGRIWNENKSGVESQDYSLPK